MKNKLTIVIAFLVGIGLGASGMLLVRSPSEAQTCAGSHGSSYSVMIMNGKVEPAGTVRAQLCDSLTITNMDSVIREIAFGPHEHHVPYDGIAERELDKNQSVTIVLNQAGTFHWHDHLHDEVEGFFAVTK